MTREEAHTFLDNLKVCIEEHPIVADWLVEIADRKTEPQTCEECEHWSDTEDGCADRHGCKTENCSEKPNNCEDLQDWKDRMWAEAIVTEPTISKMEQVEDEPQTETSTNSEKVQPKVQLTHDLHTETHECVKTTKKPCSACKYYDWEWDEHIGYREICYNIGNCQFKAKTEPQTLDDIGKQIQDAYDKGLLSDAGAVQAWYEAVNAEPQTERSE